jgi:hypothetical protein
MKFPIIFINYGNPWYLKYSLSQCIGTNPDARIILIGDESNYGYKGVEHYLAKDYFEKASTIANIYQHFSTNPLNYELFCIQRWFILYEFLVKNNFDKCFVVDSDVLIYDKISKFQPKIYQEDIGLYTETNDKKMTSSGGNIFINNKDVLLSFYQFIKSLYSNTESPDFLLIIKHFQLLQSKNLKGGVCDMTLWYIFQKNYPSRIGDAYKLIEDKFYFDINTLRSDSRYYDFEYGDNLKRIEFVNNKPFLFIKSNFGEKRVQAICLHFQGSGKKYMRKHLTYKGFYYLYNCYWIKIKNFLNGKIRSYAKF